MRQVGTTTNGQTEPALTIPSAGTLELDYDAENPGAAGAGGPFPSDNGLQGLGDMPTRGAPPNNTAFPFHSSTGGPNGLAAWVFDPRNPLGSSNGSYYEDANAVTQISGPHTLAAIVRVDERPVGNHNPGYFWGAVNFGGVPIGSGLRVCDETPTNVQFGFHSIGLTDTGVPQASSEWFVVVGTRDASNNLTLKVAVLGTTSLVVDATGSSSNALGRHTILGGRSSSGSQGLYGRIHRALAWSGVVDAAEVIAWANQVTA